MDLRKLAQGRECQAMIPNHCNHNPETTVLAHPNKKSLFKAGMGMKPPDEYGAWICSDCHDVIDGRRTTAWTDNQVLVWFYEAVFRTQQILVDEGKLWIQ
jgi:hypothetical protein